MRYHIDTIPVWDALKINGECPICAIRRRNELLEVQRYLGASVMEPDTRIQVNEKGFCAHHHAMLFAESNRLGHGLMLHSHIRETEKRLAKTLARLEEAGAQLATVSGLNKLMKKSGSAGSVVDDCCRELASVSQTCILCDSLKENVDRYVYTFLHLWKTDPEFKKAVKASKGFCLPDTELLLRAGREHLPVDQLGELAQALAVLTRDNLKRLEDEVEWFTLKFDYRNEDKPWGESRNAVERVCNKLRGWCTGEEPNPKER